MFRLGISFGKKRIAITDCSTTPFIYRKLLLIQRLDIMKGKKE